MVLLVIDVQKQITNNKLYRYDLFSENVKLLIETARKNNTEVIFIRHDDGAGQELTKGKSGFEIHEDFAPDKNEKVFDKTVNSPFKDTGLLKYLNEKREKQIIVTGLQTDYCIDAAVKCGFEHGFKVFIPQYANSTFDNKFMSAEKTYDYYNNFIWNNRYGVSLPVNEMIDIIEDI